MKAIVWIVSFVAVTLFAAWPADAAQKKRKKTSAVHQAAVVDSGPGVQGGVMRGPLYNGQDYLGDDPDPSIRAYMIKDLGMRYGQSH
jgi:hypothetical protein